MTSQLDISVVVCSLNGASKIPATLTALNEQTIRDRIDLVVVDDGSTDGLADVAASHGARVVRHDVNRGLAAARNTGVLAAKAEIVAFVDDDCQPCADWAERLLEGYAAPEVLGVGGPALPTDDAPFVLEYLAANNPLRPLELDLAESNRIAYRVWRYVLRDLLPNGPNPTERAVFMIIGANMSFRREALVEAGLFDERFRFGGDEEDLCRRLVLDRGPDSLRYLPGAVILHEFKPSLRDTLRRSFAYGKGNARMLLKHSELSPTVYPAPILVIGLLAAGVATRRPSIALAAVLLPQLAFPKHLLRLVESRNWRCLLWPYLQLGQETFSDAGFVVGYRQFRPLFRGRVQGHPTDLSQRGLS
jgi:glycosyltransferase involved in cell wall biosynthesis